jgi:TonB family protein
VQQQKQSLKMMSSKNSGFTASDIERYHSGKMSPQERHALEKAALDDPFLADALEGYAFASTPAADLQSIQSRLNEKLNRKKVVPFFSTYKWMSVAAIIVVLAGAGWFAYKASNKNNGFSVAQKNEEFSRPDKNVSSPENTIDSATSPLTNNFSGTERNQQTVTQEANRFGLTEQQPTQKKATVKSEKNKSINTSPDAFTSRVATSESKDEKNANEGYVANSRNKDVSADKSFSSEPVARTLSKTAPAKRAATDSARTLNDALAGQAKGITTNDTLNLNVVLKPQKVQMEEVVVNTGRTQKKSAHRYPVVIVDSLTTEGDEEFDDYIADNIIIPDEIKQQSITGEVQVSFDVDRNGRPVNITIEKSLCSKCDEEAVRLLKQGPKWKKKQDKKGKITIRF